MGPHGLSAGLLLHLQCHQIEFRVTNMNQQYWFSLGGGVNILCVAGHPTASGGLLGVQVQGFAESLQQRVK